MYLAAPINQFYLPTIKISEGRSEIKISIQPSFFHPAEAVHGSVYFKMLDDAAFFAVNSIVEDVFVLTAAFNTQLLLPVDRGTLIAKGELIRDFGNKFTAKASLFNETNQLIASGEGVFVKSKKQLAKITSFKI